MEKINPAYVEALKQRVKTSPYPSHMKMALTQIDLNAAEVVIELDTCHLQPFGIVHGGVMATIIDTATFWAAFMKIPETAGLVNVDLKLNYLRSVKSGRLIAHGTCLRPGRSISYSEARVMDDQDNLVAHGTSTLMVLPGNGIDLGIPKFLTTE